ncbi:hypothetical protein D3C73_1106040 [compost metagenome]
MRISWDRSRSNCCCIATVPCSRSAIWSKARASSPSSSCRAMVRESSRADSWSARQALACSRNWLSGTISMRYRPTHSSKVNNPGMTPLVNTRHSTRYWPGLKRSGSSITSMPCSGAPGNGMRNQGWSVLRRLMGQSTPRSRVSRCMTSGPSVALARDCRLMSSTPIQPRSRWCMAATQWSRPVRPPLRQAASASPA